MEGIGKWNLRRQVPESDPVYQKERKDRQDAHKSSVFAAAGINLYEADTKIQDRLVDQKIKLEQELANTIDDPKLARELAEAVQGKSTSIENILATRAKSLRIFFVNLAESLVALFDQDRHEDKNREKYISGEMHYMFGAPEIQDEFRQHFGADLSEFSPDNLLAKLRDGSISERFLYVAAKRHVEKIREQEAQLAEIVEATKTEFKTAITDAVASGFLPESVMAVLGRLDSVTVSLSDRLLAVQSSTVGTLDVHGLIKVSNEELQPHLIPRLKAAIFHEFLHELSGKSISISTQIDDGPNRIHHVFYRKSGIALSDPDLGYRPNKWLNEAITEWLALRLSGYEGDTTESSYKGSAAYPTERKELDRLFALGLEQDLVIRAYFENFSSNDSTEYQGQYFAKLIKRINELEGPAGTATLENNHVMHEIEPELHNEHVYLAEKYNVRKEKLRPDVKMFSITVTVGTNEQNTVTKEFVYLTKYTTADNVEIPTKDLLARVQTTLDNIKYMYKGKMSFSIAEK